MALFGGFGQNNSNQQQQQQNTGFGGFGTNNTSTGFGQPANTGFGSSNNTGGTLFGSSSTTTNNTNTGFGGFGASTASPSPFGANRNAFGTATTTSGGGLFGGNNTATAGASGAFGGFGTSQPSNTTSIFGGGAAKPAFGTSNTTGPSIFGGNNTGNAFGTTNNATGSGFGGAGLGTALGTSTTECQGTGSTPFQAYQEKEGTGPVTNYFQSLSFMPPYKNFSFEELRLADYNQGRRFGNSSGQAGAFGFSGFGGQQTNNTAANPFGAQTNNTSTPFGGGNQASNTFGNNTSGGLFGAKPASGGLFGTNNTTTSQPTNNLFGTTANNAPAFGRFSTNAQQQQQPKPGGFSFGTNTNTGGGFGTNAGGFGTANTTNTTGGLFGTNNQNNNSNPFGGAQQQQPASNPFGGSAFGTNQNQNQNQNQSSAPAFGGFGQNQESKPGGLFGTSNTTTAGSGIFGSNNQNNQQQPAGGSIFGNNNQQQPSGSNLFGKPSNTGTGLFGTNTASNTNNTGSNIFGGLGTNNNANQGQQNQGGLFGNTAQQQQKPPLFNTGGSSTNLFGTNNNQQQQAGNSIFGASNNSQQQHPGNLFGNSTNFANSLGNSQQQNPLLPPQTLQASLLDSNPWGSASIFSGLPPPPTQNVGPLATPISAAKSKKQSILHPTYKINPYQSQSRLVTPRRGYGFTYSTYGTPSSISSNTSTPGGFSGSLLHSSIGRGLGKSLSTSNLRRTFDSDGESILSPGAFSAGSSRFSGAGNLKKLTIDRTLRTDLFANDAVAALPSPDKADQSKQPGILKKKVSFDTNTVGGKGNGQDPAEVNGSSHEVNHNATPSAQEQGFLRSSRNNNAKQTGPKTNGVVSSPEMEQVKGNELAIVHEDGSPESSSSASSRPPPQADQSDPQPGPYYMRPSREELSKMTQDQKSKVKDFEIGREGCGHVVFDVPVNLNNIPLDEIYDNIALITLRSLTVYPDSTRKPPQGRGLNVPSTIYLENSWPRSSDKKTPTYEKSGPRFNKHVDRLRKVGGTEFVRYEKETGVWVFKVPHFTTYGFDYDDNASEGDSLHTGMMTEDPNTPTPKSRAVRNVSASSDLTPLQDSMVSPDVPSYVSSSPDDTFEFRKKKMFPGAFDDAPAFDEDHDMDVTQQDELSFLDNRLAVSSSESGEDEPSEFQVPNGNMEDQSLMVQDDDIDMIGAFPKSELEIQPKSILKAAHQPFDGAGSPKPLDLAISDDWANQLQTTVSPRKQDRQALRGSQAYVPRNRATEQGETPRATSTEKAGDKEIATSIDLMKSLFGKENLRRSKGDAKASSGGKGFEWPYPKRSKTHDNDMNEQERAFHDSFKPSWGPGSILMYSKPSQLGQPVSKSTQTGAVVLRETGTLSSDGEEIALAKLVAPQDLIPNSLRKQRVGTEIKLDHEVPVAKVLQIPFQELASSVQHDFHREQAIWELAGILFDQLGLDAYAGLPPDDPSAFEPRIRKEKFSKFWEQSCQSSARNAVSAAPNAEERAIAHLSANKIVEACDALAHGKDFRLSILVSQIGGDEIMREDMATQIHEWRELNVLSEMTEPIRALYELLAGNTCICEGKKGPLEDRARTFSISDRFKLDWKRAFGLRLWYAIQAHDPIESAIQKFSEDLKSDEGKKPLPWFLEENVPRDWQDPAPNSRQDIMWGLLLLYASSKGFSSTPPLADMVSPHNTTGNPLNARLSFQLYHSLAVRFPQPDAAKADQLTWDFATQLESSGEWLWALYAIMHLSNHEQRKLAIQSLLAHHASNINDAEYDTLTKEFKIPPSWIWSAKALLARSKEDPVAEVQCLIRANDSNEAHAVLCRTVAPKAIIEQDYTTLKALLEGFTERAEVSEWELGGQVYDDFIWLLQRGEENEKARIQRIGSLLESLPAMQEKEMAFLEKVAVKEMGRVVGEMAVREKNKDIEKAKILQLPLTDDGYLKHTLNLSYDYYGAVMKERRR